MKKYMEKIKSDIFAKTLLNLLMLLIAPFICLFVLYVSSSHVIEGREQNAMLKVVADCAEKLEREMEDANAIATYLSNNSQILQYLYHYNREEDASSIMRMMDAQKTLESLTLVMDKIALIQIYANASDTIIDQGVCGEYPERYYKKFSIAGMEYQEWRDFLERSTKTYEVLHNVEITYDRVPYHAWVMSYRIPMNSSSGKHGQIFLYLDMDSILDDFSALDYRYGGYLAVINESQEIILMDNTSDISAEMILSDVAELKKFDDVKIVSQGNEEMLVIKHFSSALQATVAMAVPKDYVYAPMKSIQILLLAILVLLVTTSVILIVLMARKLTKPFMEMHQLLNKENASSTELIDEITRLLEHNKSLKNEVMSSVPALKTASLYNLLLAGFENKEDMDKALTQIGIDRNARQYGLLIINLFNLEYKNDVQEISMQQAFVGKAIEHDIKEVQGVYFPDYERILILFAMYEENKANAEKRMDEYLEKLIYPFFEKNRLEVLISGDVSTEITDFPGMFLLAQTVLRERSVGEGKQKLKVFWYSQEKKNYLKCYYPPEMENRLGIIMIMGNAGALVEAFEDLKLANERLFEQHVDTEISKLLQALFDTLCKKQKEYRIHDVEKLVNLKEEIAANLSAGENLVQTFYLLEEAYYTCINLNGDAWKEQKKDLSEKIRLYICSNYRDPQLCLSSIAEYFSITESYLSRLYKQSFQITCNKAIESLRMEDAAQQLAQGRSVAQVAENVGYHSVQVFRRVYKKYYKEIPSKFKENLKSDSD